MLPLRGHAWWRKLEYPDKTTDPGWAGVEGGGVRGGGHYPCVCNLNRPEYPDKPLLNEQFDQCVHYSLFRSYINF